MLAGTWQEGVMFTYSPTTDPQPLGPHPAPSGVMKWFAFCVNICPAEGEGSAHADLHINVQLLRTFLLERK